MNDQSARSMEGHAPLFIRDVTRAEPNIVSSTSNPNVHTSFAAHDGKLVFTRIRVNGIIVADKALSVNDKKLTGAERCIVLDDGTDTICVFLSPRLCRRPDANLLTLSSSVTILGCVRRLDEKNVVDCGGYSVDGDLTMELYHWRRAIEARNKETAEKKDHSAENASTRGKLRIEADLSDKPSKDGPPTEASPKMVNSPSTNNRENINDMANDGQGDNCWRWSPNYAFATSSPLRALQEASNRSPMIPSPLRSVTVKQIIREDSDSFGFDDDYGLDTLDLDALEQNAIQQLHQDPAEKRRYHDAFP
ncbi:uncharacterized protein BYT42DRAFT_559158 [Radiomyces spectabilis]|uniref:uncharacterized protein n=1 Tax=Radiomyces spectabilis TaxID=64574 RepID=UPI00221F7715|nr:uncharacterized protein BYT42DRAFT_559158 [Radiomyces spectabilis]KAI8388172.1 hypothetical protein BYT42DRAFT_559158 [Radiomyces spectabilis]